MDKVKTLVDLVKGMYPHWKGLNDPVFKKDEIDYKQSMIELANDLLNRETLQRFLESGDIEYFLGNFLNVTRHKENNLLFMSVPAEGDNALLHREEMKNMAFCRALFDLIHGDGSGDQRLERFSKFVSDTGISDKYNKWTFPTFFLFLTHPETEMFIKPSVLEWFLKYMDADFSLSSNPTGDIYLKILNLYKEIGKGLEREGYAYSNMVDLQSFVFVAKDTAPGFNKIRPLLEQFANEYPATDGGKKHIAFYQSAREEAKKNFELVKKVFQSGEDITDLVLDKLLPYTNSESHRKEGKWIHWAPVFSGDVKAKMEGIKWIKSEEWPVVSETIFQFIEEAVREPQNMSILCKGFSEKNIKGFQAGTISPILNALKPEEFNLVNVKPMKVIEWIIGKSFSQSINDYLLINEEITDFVNRYRYILSQLVPTQVRPEDVFDMFCHWMVAVIDYFKTKFWKIAPGRNAEFWDLCIENGNIAIGWSDIGDISKVKKSQFDKICDLAAQKRLDYKKAGMSQVWKFSKIEVGDKIIANNGTQEVMGIGTVVRPYYFVEGEGYSHRIDVDWEDIEKRKVDKPGWVRTLMDLKREEYEDILQLPITEVPPKERYSLEDLAKDIYFQKEEVARWRRILYRKQQIVFYGPPGTGKTFIAQKLAKHLIDGTNGVRETVQFHSSYAYEDFMQGIRPQTNDGCIEYKMVPGRFLRFCSDAQSRGKAPCVLIIDEINRAKLSRVFGELMYLLEYRDQQIPLAGGGLFKVPDNVYIIGTMNTADRSIALVDHALRRRFAFIPLMPEYDVLRRFHQNNGFDPEGLIGLMGQINKDIGDLNYSLGISYFMRNDLEKHIQDIWEMEIEPYLEEFFYDQDGKAESYRWDKIHPKIFSLEEQI